MKQEIKDNSSYCSICDACGEEGCCSPLKCKQHPDGDYCESYFRDLKFSYELNEWVGNELMETLPQEVQDQYNQKWNELYEKYYTKEEK
jgi:hypothetical protein